MRGLDVQAFTDFEAAFLGCPRRRWDGPRTQQAKSRFPLRSITGRRRDIRWR
jgi:hypothetical protein